MRLVDLLLGFRGTQLLYVAAKLGLADLMADGPKRSDELARAAGADPQALHRVLRGLVSIGVFTEIEEGRFVIAPLGERLRTDVPGSFRGRAIFTGELNCRAWGSLLQSVRTGETAFHHAFGMELFDYCAAHPEAGEVFNRGMGSITASGVPAIVAAYDFSTSHTLVDVGGSHGVLLAAILQAHPVLRGVLFDLAPVLAGAGPQLQAAGVADRCALVAGDFFETVPEGGDVYLLKSIIHDWDDERSVALLKNCRRAVARGGKLLLIEQVLPGRAEHAPRNALAHANLADVNMLVMTGGRERTAAEYRSLLATADFELRRILPTSDVWSLVEAVPASEALFSFAALS